jgi:nucleoside-diphosphate-sugar epimerase
MSNSWQVVCGAGPLARSVVDALLRRGLAVRVVTRTGGAPGFAPAVTQVAADVSDPRASTTAFENAAVVYQCAQPPYHRWPQQFPALQQGVVAGALAVKARLIVAENLYGYGPVTGPMTEALPLLATTRKGTVRAQMTQALATARANHGLEYAIARGSDFFGPWVSGSAVGDRFFLAALAGKPLDLLGDPEASHSYTFIGDFGETLAVLGQRPETTGRVWHVPNAPATSSRAFALAVAKAAGTEAAPRAVPKWLLHGLGLFAPPLRESIEMLYEFEQPFVVDDGAARRELGLTSTPLAEALERTVAWYRQAKVGGDPSHGRSSAA